MKPSDDFRKQVVLLAFKKLEGTFFDDDVDRVRNLVRKMTDAVCAAMDEPESAEPVVHKTISCHQGRTACGIRISDDIPCEVSDDWSQVTCSACLARRAVTPVAEPVEVPMRLRRLVNGCWTWQAWIGDERIETTGAVPGIKQEKQRGGDWLAALSRQLGVPLKPAWKDDTKGIE